MPTQYQTSIVISGSVDPSLLKSAGFTQKQIEAIQSTAVKAAQSGKQLNSQLKFIPEHLQKANSQVTRLNDGFSHMDRLLGRIVGYQLIYGSIRGVIRMVDQSIEKIGELMSKSLDLAGQFQKQEWAIGNIVGNRAVGNKVAGRLEQLGLKGYGGNALIETAKQLSAFGVPAQYLVGTTKQLANINAAAGGSTKELETLTKSYGRVMSKGFLENKSIAALQNQGVPIMETLRKLYGAGDLVERDKKGNATKIFYGGTRDEQDKKIEEMLSKHLITAAKFQKALAAMVASGGFAANGMERYSHTWEGAVGVFNAQSEDLMKDLGDLEMEAMHPLLDWFNSSGIWDKAHKWLDHAKGWVDGFVLYFKTHDIAEKLGPTFNAIKHQWGGFNDWMDGLFYKVHEKGKDGKYSSNFHYELRPGPVDAMINKINELSTKLSNLLDRIQPIVNAFSWIADKLGKIDDILYGKILPFFTDSLTGAIQGLSHKLHQLFSWIPDISKDGQSDLYKNWSPIKGGTVESQYNPKAFPERPSWSPGQNDLYKAWGTTTPGSFLGIPFGPDAEHNHGWWDNHGKSVEDNTVSIDNLTDSINQLLAFESVPNAPPTLGGNAGLHGGLSDIPGAVYEQYPWEGHAANYGAYKGLKLHDDGTEIGLGKSYQKEHPLGSWVKVRMKDGTTFTRQVKETSERDHGVEFFSDKAGKYNRHGNVESIESASPQSSITIHNHVYAMDSHGVDRVLSEHSEKFYQSWHKEHRSSMSRSAIV